MIVLSIANHLLSKGTVDPKLALFLLAEENALDDIDLSVEGWQELRDNRTIWPRGIHTFGNGSVDHRLRGPARRIRHQVRGTRANQAS